MGYDVAERDPVLLHQVGGQFGGPVDHAVEIDPFVFAHFNADGGPIAGAVKIGVTALLRGGEVLNGKGFIHGKVPREHASASGSNATDRGQSFAHCHGVLTCFHLRISGGVNGDDGRVHRRVRSAVKCGGTYQATPHADLAQQL